MPNWLTEALKLLGFTTPFIYAMTVYGVFHFLDRKASGQAKRAISGWFKPLSYDNAAVAAAMVEVFDRFYTQPLLGWRAFVRSVYFSIIVMAIYLLEQFSLNILKLFTISSVPTFIVSSVPSNVLSDYLSLFIVRKWLIFGRQRPMLALLTGPLVGACVIFVCFVPRDVAIEFYQAGSDSSWVQIFRYWDSDKGLAKELFETSITSVSVRMDVARIFVIPAIAVHFWLPLFALGVLFVRATSSFLWAAGRMQWFLKQGRHHPLRAIGCVAAVIVFACTAAIQFIVR